MNESYLKNLREILAHPVAPFHEQNIVKLVEAWAERNGVEFGRDIYGNVLISYRRGRRKDMPKWVLVAHMDHPGFVVTGKQRWRHVDGDFLGGVPTKYLIGARLCLHSGEGREVAATIIEARVASKYGTHTCTITLDEDVTVTPGTIGTWALPPMKIRGDRLSAIACDDGVGVAGILCTFEEVIASNREVNITGLLTRAEDVGLVGASAACRLKSIPRDSLVISVECSKAQAYARIGGGVVVRVGDAFRTFDAGITAQLSGVARRLQDEVQRKGRANSFFNWTRQLMPGGTCEASVFCLGGYRAGAVCLPLGNYHNCGSDGKIKSEQVSINDFESLVTLLTETVVDKLTPVDYDARGRERLDNAFDYHRIRLRATKGK